MTKQNGKILVSACLCGDQCRYDAALLAVGPKIKKMGNIVSVCPEKLGGLPVPRAKSFIKNGTGKDVLLGAAQVVNEKGTDVTKQFLRGAHKALACAKKNGVTRAFLKSKSPSCGRNGVAAVLLKQHKIKIIWVD